MHDGLDVYLLRQEVALANVIDLFDTDPVMAKSYAQGALEETQRQRTKVRGESGEPRATTNGTRHRGRSSWWPRLLQRAGVNPDLPSKKGT